MSVEDCINRAVDGGEMDKARAEKAKARLREIEQELARDFGPDEAARLAPQKMADELELEAVQRKRRSLMQIVSNAKAETEVKQAAARLGKSLGEMAAERVESLGNLNTGFIGAENHRRVVRAAAFQKMADTLATFRRDVAGRTRNKATLADFVREAFGEDSGNQAAKELVAGWQEASEYLRKQFNRAGGAIPKLDRWGLPQAHDMIRIRKAGKEAWKADVFPRLDRDRMLDPATGESLSEARLWQALDDVYDTIASDGWSTRKPAGFKGAASIGARRTDHRFLHFKSADDWLAYQENFGTSDAFNAMVGHVDAMSRDIGAMRAFGPNPAAGVRHVADMIRIEANSMEGDGGKKFRMQRSARMFSADQLEAVYGHYIGTHNNPSHESIAGTMATGRSFLTGVQLGSALLSSATDIATMQLTAAFNGLPMTGVLKRQLQLFNPANSADRLMAARAGLVADTWSTGSAAQMRFVGEVAPSEMVNRLTDGILRVSGLSPWTDMNRQAFGLEFMGYLADNTSMRFDDLPEQLRLSMQRHTIGADDWDMIRATGIWEDIESGATLLRPGDVRARTDIGQDAAEDLATKVMDMIQTETNFAVPSAAIRGRAAVMGTTRPGTISGEIARSGMMYKSFPVTMYLTHVRRIGEAQGKWSPAKYAAALFISTTLTGALSMQLKNIAKGRDPEDIYSPQFWLRAVAQGGGFGIFGDFLLADVNRFGGGFAETIAGPVAGVASDFGKLTIGNAQELFKGEETNFGKEFVDTAGRYTPGSSLWYARLAFQRLILDQAHLMVDPDAHKRFRRAERKIEKDYGSEFWWKPGELAPRRAPQLTE